MIALIIIGVAASTLIWSFFNPIEGAKYFVFFVIIGIQGYLLLAGRLGNLDGLTKEGSPYDFSENEIDVIKKYPLYFQYPYAARELSSALSGIQLISFLWIPWLLFQHLWLYAIYIAINIFFSGYLAKSYCPIVFLKAKQNSPDSLVSLLASGELHSLESARVKILQYSQSLNVAK